ncbi:MAG: SIMPL domain-containing protein [Eubacteriales bacterium]
MNEGGRINLRSQPGLWISVIITAGLIISTWIFTNGLVKYKASTGAVTVTGSAKREIKSDWVVWSGSFSFQSPSLTEAYKGLVENRNKVKTYFLSKGIPEQELIFSSVFTTVNKAILPNGQISNTVESYLLSENVEIR